MRGSHPSILVTLLVMSFGCAPIVDNSNRRGEAPQVSATDDQSPPVSDSERAATPPSSGGSSSSPVPAGEQRGAASMPFIAETKSPVEVISLASPGRLEVIDGCLTVAIRGSERATAVFPPGVKPELRGNDVVAVSFEGRRILVGEETLIPGGGIRLSSDELVKPIPSYCPKVLFGLGG